MPDKGKVRQIFDEAALAEYLRENVKEIIQPIRVEQFTHGQSNPTYLLTDANGTKYVLRKQPPGELISKTAHAVDREYRVLKAVGDASSVPVPVPKVYCLCKDKKIVGSMFYIMQFLDGRIFVDASLPEIKSKEEKAAMWKSAVDAVAKLHSIDPKEIGLSDYGPQSDFYPRQARSLAKVSRAQAAVKSKDGSKTVGDLPHLDELAEFFATACPTGETTIMHGDYKMDNMVFHKTKPEVIGLLDWELSTLGHPHADLGNLFMPFFWPHGDEKSDLAGFSEEQLASLPSLEELLKYYCQKRGRQYPLPKWLACESFAFFRLSVISQGIAARFLLGTASSAKASEYGELFKPMAQLAYDKMKEAKASS